jgi:hypothetical protein
MVRFLCVGHEDIRKWSYTFTDSYYRQLMEIKSAIPALRFTSGEITSGTRNKR